MYPLTPFGHGRVRFCAFFSRFCRLGRSRACFASPLDGRPRRAENFDPEHLLADGGLQTLPTLVCLIQFVFICVSLHDIRTHPPTPRWSLLSARSLCNVFGPRRKWEQSFSKGCTEPVCCPGTCKLSDVAHSPSRGRRPLVGPHGPGSFLKLFL